MRFWSNAENGSNLLRREKLPTTDWSAITTTTGVITSKNQKMSIRTCSRRQLKNLRMSSTNYPLPPTATSKNRICRLSNPGENILRPSKKLAKILTSKKLMSAMAKLMNIKNWMSMTKKSKIDGVGTSEQWGSRLSPNKAKPISCFWVWEQLELRLQRILSSADAANSLFGTTKQ
jgi:hypothetical protein